MKQTDQTLWVIQHAIRTPVKKGNKQYLRLKQHIQMLRDQL
jgi:3-methyladenine DNA glycosylase AlkC